MTEQSQIGRTIESLLNHRAANGPDAVALTAPGRPALSYAQLRDQVRQFAQVLRGVGVEQTTRVAVVLPNGPEMAVAFLAIASGAICAPLNPAYQHAEFRFYLPDIDARFVVVRKGESGAIRDVAVETGLTIIEIDWDTKEPAGCIHTSTSARVDHPASASGTPDDIALVLHTSGTTARPKIVPLTQANMIASALNIAAHLGLGPADRCLNVMPLFHIHGLVAALLSSLAGGGSVTCTPGFEVRGFFDWVAETDPTWYSAVPTMHQAILAEADSYRRHAPDHRFRFIRSSSAALPPSVLAGIENLTGAPLIEAYGMTEASHQMASNPLPPQSRKPGTVGVPAGAAMAIMAPDGRLLHEGETGEIVIRGPGVTSGYLGNPEANATAFSNGWFRTGDQGRFDEEGYLVISGRLKEIINRGGEKISPREVDEALLELPDVAQAVAFAMPHATLGEDLVAAVVLRSGAASGTEEVRQALFARLSAYKVPSQIIVVAAIPKGPTGKIQRTTLHEKLGSLLVRSFRPPDSDLEQRVVSAIETVLQQAPVGMDDNFFLLGGDSLTAASVITRLNQVTGIALTPVALFQQPTPAALARCIEQEIQARSLEEDATAAEIDALSDEEVRRLLEAQEEP